MWVAEAGPQSLEAVSPDPPISAKRCHPMCLNARFLDRGFRSGLFYVHGVIHHRYEMRAARTTRGLVGPESHHVATLGHHDSVGAYQVTYEGSADGSFKKVQSANAAA